MPKNEKPLPDIEKRAQNRYVKAAFELLEKISESFDPETENRAYVAGGIAVIFWLQNSRVTHDLDAMFEGELVSNIDIDCDNSDIHIDLNYNDALSLVQEDYRDRAVPVAKFGSLQIHIVAPVDLVLMKISRGTEKDMRDARELIASGLVNKGRLMELAEDAFKTYIGNPVFPRHNYEKILKEFRDVKVAPRNFPCP